MQTLVDREEWSIVIDTDSYSGNFEREMFSFIFGLGDCPGESTRDLSYYRTAAEIAAAWDKMPEDIRLDLLDGRVRDHGDDSVHRSYVDIAPTPGFFNDGNGTHYEDSEKNRRKVPERKRYPAYQSVVVFLRRRPTDEELTIVKQRAEQFCTFPKKNEWDQWSHRPKIIGYRLVVAKTTIISRRV